VHRWQLQQVIAIPMIVQVKAQLYRDQKRLWRVRLLDASIRDKGLPVPQGLRDRFTDDHNGKSVIVEKVDGQIVGVLLEGESTQAILKSVSPVPITVTTSRQPAVVPSASIVAEKEGIVSCSLAAYRCAMAAKGIGKEYKNHAKSLPMMIRINGLGATLAFLKSKDDPHFNRLYQDIAGYLRDIQTGLKDGEFSAKIIECDSAEIIFLTKEVLAFLAWLRRFAEGLIQEVK
jgi:CRISPR-associated protein Cmr5